jgi:hypothetical protein
MKTVGLLLMAASAFLLFLSAFLLFLIFNALYSNDTSGIAQYSSDMGTLGLLSMVTMAVGFWLYQKKRAG